MLSAEGMIHSKGITLGSYIKRLSQAKPDTANPKVTSLKVNRDGVTFPSGSGNNPYPDFGTYGRVSVSSSISSKTALALMIPSGFSPDQSIGPL